MQKCVVLIVEDQPFINQTLRRILEKRVKDAEIYSAFFLDQAWDLWRKHKEALNVVICDAVLPRTKNDLDDNTGQHAARLVQKIRAWNDRQHRDVLLVASSSAFNDLLMDAGCTVAVNYKVNAIDPVVDFCSNMAKAGHA